MGYQGNYPPSTPLNPTQLGTGVVTTDAIANGAVVPADLSTGGPYWDTSGNVGIGTSSPSYKLDVSGNARVSSDVRTPNYYAYNSAGNYSGLGFYDSVSLTTRYAVLETQIGTATILKTDGATPLIFGTNASERMRIDSSGNVGIGTSSPVQKLQVANGNIYFSTTNYVMWDTNGNYGIQSDGSSRLSFFAGGGSERMRIDSSGNVGINSTNPTQYDTSGGRILNIRGTASNSSPATIFMNGNSSLPGAGYYTQEVFTIGVSASQEISRVTGTGANGFRSMIRISLCGHTGAKGNGHIYAMYYWDGGTAAPVQIFRYDSGTNIPGLSFNTSTSNVLITNLSSSDGSNQFQGVMMIEYFLPVDFAASTYTIS